MTGNKYASATGATSTTPTVHATMPNALFARMAAVHEQWVIELVDGLKTKKKADRAGLLGELKQHITRTAAH